MKKIIPIIVACTVLLFTSCESLSEVSELAGAFGLIDSDVAESISKTSNSIDKLMQDITPEQEYYIGRAVAGTILEKYKLYHSPELQNYLNNICNVIVINSPKPVLYKGYFVAILDTDEVNAFATSGGHILVSRGLLSCTNSEDALAAVLSHEIAHIQLQHSIKAIKSSRATTAILDTANTAFTLKNNGDTSEIMTGFGDSINDIMSKLVETGYSKQQEFDADSTAPSLMSSAGYNPNAMKEMLNLLEEKDQVQNQGFSKTHPTPKARKENLKKQYNLYKVKTNESAREERFIRMKSLLK